MIAPPSSHPRPRSRSFCTQFFVGLSILAAFAFGLPAAGVSPVHARQAAIRSDTIVKHAGAPRHTGVARLVPALTIGVVDGPPEYTFATVNEVLETRDGGVLILEVPSGSAATLRKFDATGRYVRNIGHTGEGPGEFRGPNGLAELPDGRILLYDSPARRINVYSADGESVATWLLPPLPVSSGGIGNLRVGPSGTIYLQTTLLAREREPGVPRQRAVIRLRDGGGVIDTIMPDLLDVEVPSVTRTQRTSTGGVASTTFTAPYSPQAVWAWSSLGYLVTGITRSYAFEMRVPPARSRAIESAGPPIWRLGDPVLSVRRTVPVVSVSRAERGDQRARIEAQLAATPGQISGSIPEIPEVKPAYKRLMVGDDGRIWVHISTPSEKYDPPAPSADSPGVTMGGGVAGPGTPALRSPRGPVRPAPWREPAVYDVFEPDGTYIGQVGVPYNTRILSTTGDKVWGVVRDEDDVPVVKRFRVGWR